MNTHRAKGARSLVAGRLLMLLQVSPDLALEVEVRLGYDRADPYAVSLTFHIPGDEPVTWMLARELLLDGVSVPSGEGDVVFEPVPGEDPDFPDIRIRLDSPAGTAVLYSPALPLIAFLGKTDQVVPMGEEQVAEDLDQQLARILGGAA
jgi:hypothetical protein